MGRARQYLVELSRRRARPAIEARWLRASFRRPRTLPGCFALVGFALFPQETYVDHERGFSLSPTDAGWRFEAKEDASGVDFVLRVSSVAHAVGTLTVYVDAWDGQTDAAGVRDGIRATLRAQGATGIESGVRELAGERWSTLRLTQVGADERNYDAELWYAIRAPNVYALQIALLEGQSAKSPIFESLRASFSFVTIEAAPDDEGAGWKALAKRCDTLIEWSPDWSSAAARAKERGGLVLCLFEHRPGLDLPETARMGPLCDADLVELAAQRLGALRLGPDVWTPFVESEEYGMGAYSWGLGVLFATPEGQVVAEVGLLDGPWLYRRACEALALYAPRTFADASAALSGGALERALELTRQSRGEDDAWLRARAARRSRRGELALESLLLAERKASAQRLADIAVERALVHLRLGDSQTARRLFEEFVQVEGAYARTAEALYWLGALEQRAGGASPPAWQRAIAEHPDDPFAWRAAAGLVELESALGGRLDWPSERVVEALTDLPLAKSSSGSLEGARRDARSWLLETQAEDGSWTCPEALYSSSFGYTTATTAIAGWSLSRSLDSAGVRAALERALDYVRAQQHGGALTGGEGLYGTYSIWQQTFALWFYARCLQQGLAEREALLADACALVESIAARQQASGGWPYVFFPGDPRGEAFDPSASFLTAAVAQALLAARAAGVEVPDVALSRAKDLLERMRLADGGYRYMPATGEREVDGYFPEAAGRGPVCAWTVLELSAALAGERDARGLSQSLESYLRHADSHWHERGKVICHTGPEGQGAHYLMFDLAFACAASSGLPASERRKVASRLRERLLDVREEGGTLRDFPMLGRVYGTAMGLAAMDWLLDGAVKLDLARARRAR